MHLWLKGGLALLGYTASLFAHAAPITLAEAKGWNAFIRQDFISQQSDSEGRLAVGGNAYLQSYSVNSFALPGTALQAGGRIEIKNGQINGDAQAQAISQQSAGLTGSFTQAEPSPTWAGQWQFLEQMSAWLDGNSLGTFSTAERKPWGEIVLTGYGPLGVFDLEADWFEGASSLRVSGFEPGATLILTIQGETLQLKNMDLSTVFDPFNVLINLPDALSIDIRNTSPHAHFLAPLAEVTGANGHITGTVVANQWNSSLELHSRPFRDYETGKPGPQTRQVPEPGALALIGLGLLVLGMRRKPSRR